MYIEMLSQLCEKGTWDSSGRCGELDVDGVCRLTMFRKAGGEYIVQWQDMTRGRCEQQASMKDLTCPECERLMQQV